MIRFCIGFLFLLISFLSVGQQITDKKTSKLLSKADVLIKERDFVKAKGLILDAIERDSTYRKSYHKLFIVLRVLAQEDALIEWKRNYIRAVPQELIDPGVWQSLASYEHSLGNYEKALSLISNVEKPDSILLGSINYSIESIVNQDRIKITELPKEINALRYQYLPVLTLDGRTIMFTGREEGSDEDIYEATFDGENWNQAQPISDIINTSYNEGACSISADGRILIFTACEGRRTVGNCDLYMARKVGEIWGEFRNLGKKVNSRFWDSQPSLSADGRTLYFVSNRPGGIGGRDIWKTVSIDGEWQSPVNLGAPINTRKDETTPYIYSNNKTLFFSSNGHIGLGGFDIYKVLDVELAEIENLGSPINSFDDEVSMFIASDGKRGLYAKERLENRQIVNSRIQFYEREADKIIEGVNYITGVTKDFETHESIPAKIELVNLQTREVEYQTVSDDSNGKYFMVLPLSQEYGVFVESEGYLPEELSIQTSKKNQTDTLDFELKPIKVGARIVLRNIYFDFDSDKIKEESEEEIDRITRILNDNGQMTVQISGHTDNQGSESYNNDLSLRRAKSVYDKLIDKGIPAERLIYKGFGSSKPLEKNDSEENRQKNRRIEFEIIKSTAR